MIIWLINIMNTYCYIVFKKNNYDCYCYNYSNHFENNKKERINLIKKLKFSLFQKKIS